MKGAANVKLRPLKFAFLVNPNDSKAIDRAIEINSTLWGGSYNPIIPTFKKLPSSWKKPGLAFGYTSKTILKGYIEAFNPDFLVPLGECKKMDLKDFSQEIIDDKSLNIEIQNATPDYGIGIFEVLQGFFEKELKFKRKYPIDLIYPLLPKKRNLFFKSIFGIPPKDIAEILEKNWKEALDWREVDITLENYSTNLASFNLRKLLGFQIEASNNSGWHRGQCVFLMDADSNQDIIDYWNLRAMGWSVFPIPIQSVQHDSIKEQARKFVEKNSGVSKYNKNIHAYCTLMKSQGLSDEHVKDFANSLVTEEDKKSGGSRFSIQHWYPRIWDEWARDRDGVGHCELKCEDRSYDFTDSSDEITVKTVDPDFAFQFGGYNSSFRFANDIAISNYNHEELYANVIPEGGKSLNRTLNVVSLNEWRFSKKSSTYFSKFKNWSIHLKLPKAEEVFKAWMQDQGLEINLSGPGKIAKQMIKHLGGVYGINTLANENMIALLKSMEFGKEKSKEQFWAEILKVTSTNVFKGDASKALKGYMERKMFQLGVSLQCPTCTHSSWYDIKALNYVVVCPNCLEEFDIPTHSPDDIKWVYKTSGPFGLPKRAEGVYPTLLTLRIFSSLFHDSPITPMLSFETKINEVPIEVDLGLFFRRSRFRNEENVRIIFAECKSENSFEKKDIEKMELIAKKFPGAVLVFASLKGELSKKEITLLKPLVNKCRRYYKADEPYNPVMILTKTELFAHWDLYQAWKDKGGKHASFANRIGYDNELLNICDITQQLYLGMKPWQQFIGEYFDKKRKRRDASILKSTPENL